MNATTEFIKKVRNDTGMGINDIKNAVAEVGMDSEKVKKLLFERGCDRVKPKETNFGKIETYLHNGKIGAIVEVNCNTDFAAKTDTFQSLCKEVAMQVAATNPVSVETLLESEYIRDPRKKVKDLVGECSAKCSENVVVRRFSRYELSESAQSSESK